MLDRSRVDWKLACVECGELYPGLEPRLRCACGGTLDVERDLRKLRGRVGCGEFDRRLASRKLVDRSGVWRFRELILPLSEEEIVSKPEGNTNLYESRGVSAYAGLERLHLKHEGENPTGSFKDRGMSVGVSLARALGKERVACVSAGSAAPSMAAYASAAGLRSFVLVPEGETIHGMLAQALAYGARIVRIEGQDVQGTRKLAEELCAREDLVLLSSINPFRIEGEKSIVLEMLQDLEWREPDWIVLPGGNLGNASATGKALLELRELGLIKHLPRVAVVQAEGAAPFALAQQSSQPLEALENPQTIAAAIRVGHPLCWRKALRTIRSTDGIVESVSDQEILDAKARLDASGIGAEPASCAALAGVRKLVGRGVIQATDVVCAILTGHLLEDPDSVLAYHEGRLEGIEPNHRNESLRIAPELDALIDACR